MAAPDDALLIPARWVARQCTVAQALLEIEDVETRAKVQAAADDERVPAANLEKYLRAVIGDLPGWPSPKQGTIRRHQIKACGC